MLDGQLIQWQRLWRTWATLQLRLSQNHLCTAQLERRVLKWELELDIQFLQPVLCLTVCLQAPWMFGLLWFELDNASELSTWTMCQGKNILKSHPSRHQKKGVTRGDDGRVHRILLRKRFGKKKNWVVVSNIFYFHPIWGRFPIWLIFFKGVETTN